MKSWLWIVLGLGLLLMVSATTVEAWHIKTAKAVASADTSTAVPPIVLKCPKCQNDMEQGFLLDIQGNATNDKAATNWVQGPAQRSFWQGVTLKGRKQLQVTAFRCTNCGYLEMYAK